MASDHQTVDLAMRQLNYWLREMTLAHELGDNQRQRECKRLVFEHERLIRTLRLEARRTPSGFQHEARV